MVCGVSVYFEGLWGCIRFLKVLLDLEGLDFDGLWVSIVLEGLWGFRSFGVVLLDLEGLEFDGLGLQ